MATGRLRIHLGVAPGVGTTHALLDEARRRRRRGRTVVVGRLDAAAADFEHPEGPWDAAGVLSQHPDVVLMDDLGAPLDPGGAPRWTAVGDLLAAGVDVVASAHITQVASLADEVERLTGSRPPTSVPDSVFADAAAVELVDMAPDALRRRLAHGGVVPPDAMDAATAARYSPEALAGLRALAFTWLGALLGAGAGDLDAAVVPASQIETVPARPGRAGVGASRQLVGLALALGLPAAVTVLGLAGGRWLGVTGTTLVQLLAVVVTALVGGLWPALVAAVVGSQLINWFFIPPYGSLDVAEPHNLATLVVFVLVGGLVGAVVHRASVGAAVAAREAATSRSLAGLAEATIRRDEALPRMLEQGRASFGMTSASLLRRRVPGGGWIVLHEVGHGAPATPEDADVSVTAGADLMLAMNGRALAASDQTVLRAFAAQTQNLLERDELARSAALAARLEATERLRDSLLVAVGHDLRRPLAAARASVEGLRNAPQLDEAERAELLADATDALARLSRILDDLLDLSRLQTGALRVARAPVWIDEVVPPALDDVGPAAGEVRVLVPDDLPPADADAALVRRILANLVGNALEHGGGPVPPTVQASAVADRVEVRVVDRGRGIPDRATLFEPFQHRGDAGARDGLGLGLALSRGLAEAMGGRLDAEDTPGGGATFVLVLPEAAATLGPPEVGQRERGDA